MRSISVPMNGETTMPGRLTSAPSKPAAAGDPVRSSTSHGTAIITIPLPMPEEMFETCNITNGIKRFIIEV